MEILCEKLKSYHGKGIYPFHMPGHKRNKGAVDFQPDLSEDITEIDGFDYLHRPRGILREAQETAASLYGADETFFSVNGSTGALLAAISACTSLGGSILIARNCHQSVYHGVALRNLESWYVYPQILGLYGLNGPICPGQVAEALAAHPDVQAVLVTSPTYEGVVSPIQEIADLAHGRGLPLIVDEAHGAHFPFHGYFPDSALNQGADVVVHSLHKTLPALTQTALLHVKGNLVDRDLLRRHMGMYQTSSPSYLLMGSMDSCIRRLYRDGPEDFRVYVERLESLRKRLSCLQYIRLLGEELCGEDTCRWLDRSKLVLDVQRLGMNGHQLYHWLLGRHSLQMEMEAATYVLGITSVADTEEGYGRLCRALECLEHSRQGKEPLAQGQAAGFRDGSSGSQNGSGGLRKNQVPKPGGKVFRIGEAMEMMCAKIPLRQSVGQVAGDFLYLYPPGIPLAVPGERVTSQLVGAVQEYQAAGLEVKGLAGPSGQEISIICDGTIRNC